MYLDWIRVWVQIGLGLGSDWVRVWVQIELGLDLEWVGFGFRLGWVWVQIGLGFSAEKLVCPKPRSSL